jgi:large subunit ribosomal protein L9
MEVILTEDVPKLGKMGDVVKVREGYGRNFLIPQKKAIISSSKNLKAIEAQKKSIAAKVAKLREGAEGLAKRLEGLVLTVEKEVGEKDRLFGSVTNIELADALAKQGIEIDRHKIVLESPIKTAGEHEVEIKLHGDVKSIIKVVVVSKSKE